MVSVYWSPLIFAPVVVAFFFGGGAAFEDPKKADLVALFVFVGLLAVGTLLMALLVPVGNAACRMDL
jgi:hypothetical protein